MNKIWKTLVALVCVASVSTAAFADIKAYNAAVKAGDYKAAATEAAAIWPDWDRTKQDTAVLAREFGFASLVAGRYDLAVQLGRFLVEQGAQLPFPDDQPLISAVLYRAADYKAGKSDEKLKALRDALMARVASPGVDMTSVISWEALYTGALSAGWQQAASDANAAAAFYAREKSVLPRQRSAQIFSASASFVGGRNRSTAGKNDYYDAMADVHDAIVADIEAATPGGKVQLWPLKWKAEAWALAMQAYLASTYQQVGSNIDTSLDARGLAQPKYAQVAEDPILAGLPFCDGKFEGKAMRYPVSKEFKGLVGSVIARMETAVDGKVTKVEIMAAVPGDGFASDVSQTLSTWAFKPAKGIDTSRCRLQSKNQYYKVIFRIL